MQRFGVFLRAVNVGGTGKLPMTDLRDICAECGFENIKTYIASGNVALNSALAPREIAARLEEALQGYAGKPAGVFVRSHAELTAIAAENPFADAAGNQVTTILLNEDPEGAIAKGAKGQNDELIQAGTDVIYVHYPSGMGTSKLKLLGVEQGTARNMNTIAKMVALTAQVFR